MMNTLGILLIVALFLGTTSAATLGVVETEGGLILGENIQLGLRSMDVFKGIPFAAEPGLLEKPKPHPGWKGLLKATAFAKRCLQMSILQTSSFGSTDCLYLNIWVPHGQYVSSNLPVMIWFYGGGFMVGGSMGANFLDNYLYSGQEIADRGKVIVVSVGYRVGTLGFLSSGDSELPGNYGLWDQHAAIAWVHKNIRAFGGNPDSITLFGESAGAASVSYQTISPYNKGLVKRGIAQSGVALSPWAFMKNPRKVAELVALRVGCPVDDKMVACLKTTDPVVLTMGAPPIAQGTPDNPTISQLTLAPAVDGDFIPDQPGNLFHNAADIDYLLGVNNMDGHLFIAQDIPSLDGTEDTPVEHLKSVLGAFTKDKGQAGRDVAFAEYSATWGATPSQQTIKRTAVDIGTDYMFLIPIQAALSLHTANAKSGRTYSYLFSEPSFMAGPGRPYPSWMGADHADDLQFVFGKPFTTPVVYGDRYRHLSSYMITYWTNFARTGDPNKGEAKLPATWPLFTSTGRQFLEIRARMDETYVRKELRQRFVHLWTSVLPGLPTTTTQRPI